MIDVAAPPIQYPIDDIPVPGVLVPVAEGIFWLRLRLPFRLNHVNLWLLDDGPGWTLIDTGLNDAETRAVLEGVFARGLQGRPIHRLLVTHHHPDHCGLASWIVERWDIPLFASRTEWLMARLLSVDQSPESLDHHVEHYARSGLDSETIEQLKYFVRAFPGRAMAMVPHYTRLRNGDLFAAGGRSWRVLTAGGHAPEQICLYSAADAVFIAADQVLPKITPNIGVSAAEAEGDPLAEYLESLDRFGRVMAPQTLVLPSHGVPFTGLHRRLAELAQHHHDRLDALLVATETPRSAAELLPALFRLPLDPNQMFFAMGEALAHLNRLAHQGRLIREADPSNTWRYRRLPPPASDQA